VSARSRETRTDLVRKEVARLRDLGEQLERDWRRIPYLGGAVVLVGPAFWIWGPTVGLYALLCVPCLVVTALYLVGVRRAENREQVADYERQLKRMDADAARAAQT
jgi:hypothetical protein